MTYKHVQNHPDLDCTKNPLLDDLTDPTLPGDGKGGEEEEERE